MFTHWCLHFTNVHGLSLSGFSQCVMDHDSFNCDALLCPVETSLDVKYAESTHLAKPLDAGSSTFNGRYLETFKQKTVQFIGFSFVVADQEF